MRFLVVGLFGWMLTAVWSAQAEDSASVERIISDKIQGAVPQLPINSIKPSAIKGLYEVELANGERVFATEDGGHFVAGDLFQVSEKGLVNLTEQSRDVARAEKMAALDDEQLIVFSPENKKASVLVFTDVDCGYCRKLHLEMEQYLARGIEIKYLAFPRAGIGSNSYKKIVSAWCAEDRQEAITRLKKGETIATRDCENPVAEHYSLGSEIGVRGTPALVLESGQMVPGFIEPDRLAKLLGI